MPKWLQKSLVVLITVLTFGLVTPSQSLLIVRGAEDNTIERNTIEEKPCEKDLKHQLFDQEEVLQLDKERWVQQLVKEAEIQSYLKFGTKIKPIIEDEFREIILPNVEKAINSVTEQFPEEDLVHLTITEFPGKGKSEKIFHITNQQTGRDIIRFHVRRDQPPKQGYWFNFHYHTCHDNFQTHYDLGTIYWAKNTPPNWVS